MSADFNNYGYLNIYTVAFGGMQQSYVYLNNGNGTFNASIIPGDIGGATYSANAGDFNRGGNVDLYVTNLSMGGSVGVNKFYLACDGQNKLFLLTD
ncbi:FG-GAP-like repeat-containing protein [Thalassolituus oleivorans]|uniref:FG-GAP-like repeat-containing protein n=1 Tax=Thalassolituus oleivorans TaxID=187493 RepID=UPI0023F32AAE|nr:FG-GAP-like repeat-containing protein [Thalassolituus oleivorans]